MLLKSISFLVFLYFANVARAQNSCHLRELDLCLASGLASGQNLPTSEAEIKKQCNSFKEMYECVGNYTRRCSTKSMREFIRGIQTQGGEARSWYDEFCKKENSEERTNFLKHSGCLNNAQKEARPCIRDLTVALDKAINSDIEQRIPGMCCAVRRMRECTTKIISDKCGKEGMKYMSQMLSSVAGTRLPELACREYDPASQVCADILPKPGSKAANTRSNSVLSRLLNTYAAL